MLILLGDKPESFLAERCCQVRLPRTMISFLQKKCFSSILPNFLVFIIRSDLGKDKMVKSAIQLNLLIAMSSSLSQISAVYPILFFDGECFLCNELVQWLMKRDSKRQFKLAMLQTNAGKEVQKLLQQQIGRVPDTLVLYHQKQLMYGSVAVIQILIRLGGIWKIIGYIYSILPRFLREALYNYIASNRYRFFGKKTTCSLSGDYSWKDRLLF
jgi:predicted DCC family thiol-disulfide oxidoreductase YuxK